VIFRRGSGCYGVNGADTVTYDTAILSQAVGRPVRVQLTRKDGDGVRELRARVRDRSACRARPPAGTLQRGITRSWSPGLGNRPGTNRPGNIITGSLLGFPPADFAPRSAGPAPTQVNNKQQRRAVPTSPLSLAR